MKLASLKTSLLFLYGFGVGIVLFYLQFRSQIIEFIEERKQKIRNKKRQAKSDYEESSFLEDLEPEQKSLTFERFFQHLRNNYHAPVLDFGVIGEEESGSDIISTGELIRQYIGTEYGDHLLFQDFESFESMQNSSFMDFGPEFFSCYPRLNRPKSRFSSECNLDNQTQNVPIYSTSLDKKLKLNKSEPSRNHQQTSQEREFEKFAKERLKMPCAVFVTPYPLHIMYRKLRTSANHSSHTDFGFYHPLIFPDWKRTTKPRFSSYHLLQNSLYHNEKYGPDLDLKCVHPNDYELDSNLSLQFRELLLKLIDEHVCNESWVECYYCPPRTTQQVTRYIVDLPQYKLLIQPLYFNINSNISHFLSEYYKIVQKPF